MNALTIVDDQDQIKLALASETLTAREWAKAIGIEDRSFRLRNITHASMEPRSGGLTRVFAYRDLPLDYQQRLTAKREQFHCRSNADLLTLNQGPRWKPDKKLSEKTKYEQSKAQAVKEVLDVYFLCLSNNVPEKDANRKARAKWLEIFGEACHESTIRRRAGRVEAAGGPELAPIEAYADCRGGTAHNKARLAVKLDIPYEFISQFKAFCLKPGVGQVSAAFRKFDIDWKSGEEVPGYGRAERPGMPFPLTLEQCRKFAPPAAAIKQASAGKFAAKVSGALITLETSSMQMRLGERYIFDDTRINIVALDDVTGDPVTLKSYWCMEESTRRIVGFCIMKARNASQADVDALVARVLRTAGMAALNAGYKTTLKFERGATACSPARQRLLESMFPGQIIVSRTDMIGGTNAPGDFNQDASGNFFGKGKIESFMRTLGYFCRHIPGQRGGNFALQPAMLGIAGEDRSTGNLALSHTKGTQVEVAQSLAKATKALALVEGTSQQSLEATTGFDIKNPLYHVSQVVNAMALSIAYYNTRTDHRMEGFREIPVDKENGGRKWRKESPNEKAFRLERELAALGKAPVRISPADACLLMQKAKLVTVKPDGVRLAINGTTHRFYKPDSRACYEAERLATLERRYVAIYDEEWPQEIYLLRNKPSDYPDKKTFDFFNSNGLAVQTGDAPVFLEALPLYVAPETNNPEQMAQARAAVTSQHDRVARQIAKDYEPVLQQEQEAKESNTRKLLRVITTTNGDQRDALPTSELAQEIGQSRSAAQPVAESELEQFLASGSATNAPQEEQEPEII